MKYITLGGGNSYCDNVVLKMFSFISKAKLMVILIIFILFEIKKFNWNNKFKAGLYEDN